MTHRTRLVALTAQAAFFLACHSAKPDSLLLEPDVSYDTVTVVGRADESRPLFIYARPVPYLLNDSTVAYSDPRSPGRMMVANLFTGDGWQVASGRGEDGPGQFGGAQPLISTSRDTIHTLISGGGAYNAWTEDGTLVATARFSTWGSPTEVPLGLMGRRVATLYNDLEDRTLLQEQIIHRAIRIYDPENGLIAEISENIPPVTVLPSLDPAGFTTIEQVGGQPLWFAARGETLVWGLVHEHRITVHNAQGIKTAERDLPAPMASLFIDSDERIWATTEATDSRGLPLRLVLNANLETLFTVAVAWVVDAKGDFMLALEDDKVLGLRHIVLLKIRYERADSSGT